MRVLPPWAQTTASLTASGTLTYGSPVTLTAAVAGVSGTVVPTGSFTFTVDGSALGSAPVSASGLSTLVTSAIPPGADVLQATYSGDLTYAGATTNSISGTGTRGVADLTLGGLNATYTGTPQIVTVETQPSSLNYTLAYDGGSAAPIAPGTYSVFATVDDPDYTGLLGGQLHLRRQGFCLLWAAHVSNFNTKTLVEVERICALTSRK